MDVAKAVLEDWVFMHGSDVEDQSTLQFFKSVSQFLKDTNLFRLTYFSQINEQVMRYNQALTAMLQNYE